MTISQIFVRPATHDDAHALSELLNGIIAVGGSTAIEKSLSSAEFQDYFLQGEEFLNCFVAVDEDGNAAGFQYLGRKQKLANNWADIATFARLNSKIRGVGSALFKATHAWAKANEFIAINATIRADNVSGLAYYQKIGFRDYAVTKDVALQDGTLVDRVSKRIFL